MTIQAVTATVPGKIIFSGEHAVLYGCLAIATAVDRYVTIKVSRATDQSIELVGIGSKSILPVNKLTSLTAKLRQRYNEFTQGQRPIVAVLDNPQELIYFILGQINHLFPQPFKTGLRIEVISQIPIGCGLGSSAAVTLAMLGAINTLEDLSLSEKNVFDLALEAENLQHGYSSGLDLEVCYRGGGVRYTQQETAHFTFSPFPYYLINTGTPKSSTGECVMAVRSFFEQDHRKAHFQQMAEALSKGLEEGDAENIKAIIRCNTALLEEIGVVPLRIQKFIRQIESKGGAAKICGAGSISGDSAGGVLVIMDEPPKELCEAYGYSILPMKTSAQGLRVEIAH